MPATAAAAAAAEGARATRCCARAASVCRAAGRVHVRAHAAIGSAAQLSSLSACRLTAGTNSA
eukprot:4046602-Prymnesium_polylepis.1